MKKVSIQLPLLVLLVISFAPVGCSKTTSQAPAPLASEKVPATINQAFNQSSETTRQLASVYVSDYQNQNISAAFTNLRVLSQKNDLTPEQRVAVTGAMLTTMKQLRAAADGGDQAAQAALSQDIINH